jgi:phage-related protein (TIGR01555 family)
VGFFKRFDGWSDLLTGFGTSRDKSQAGDYTPNVGVSMAQAEELYAGDAIAARIIDVPVGDMTREGIEFKTDDSKVEEAVSQALRDLELLAVYADAERDARIYGGSLLILGVNDGQQPDLPIDETRIQVVRFVESVDRYSVSVLKRFSDPQSKEYGQPEVYGIIKDDGTTVQVHASRTCRLLGVPLPKRLAVREDGWGQPVFKRYWNALRGYHAAHNAAGHILSEFIIGIYRLDGLASALASGGTDGAKSILARFSIMDAAKGLYRAIILDREEQFERNSANVSGLSDLVTAAERRLVAETGIPHSLLLGESPGASLGEQGAAQQANWYDVVAAQQEARMRPALERITRLLLLSKEGPTGGKEPDTWKLEFRPLWQMDAKEQAEIRKLTAEADVLYIGAGVLIGDEVAEARFGPEGWSADLTLDFEAREAPDVPAGETEPPPGQAA